MRATNHQTRYQGSSWRSKADCAFLHILLIPLKFEHPGSEIYWRTQFVSTKSAPKVIPSSPSIRRSQTVACATSEFGVVTSSFFEIKETE